MNIHANAFLLAVIASIGSFVAAQFKNVIVVIPDGCDEAVYSMGRWYKGEPLFVDTMDQGRVIPYMANSIIADSAPGGTAFATGEFSTDRFISVGPRRDDTLTTFADDDLWPAYVPIPTALEAAKAKGMAVGLIATSTVTHATPGSYGAHVDERSKEPEMAKQMVYQKIDLIMGGGRSNLLPQEDCYPIFGDLDGRNIGDCRVIGPCGLCQGSCHSDDDCEGDLICYKKDERTEPGSPDSLVPGCSGLSTSRTNWCIDPAARASPGVYGRREDCLNLEEVLTERGYDLCYTKDEMMELSGDNPVWCSFAARGMAPDMDRATFSPDEPSLAEMTAKAIEILSKNKNGFFLMVEGSQVDWAGHANDPVWMITDFIAFDDAVKVATEWAMENGETAVLGSPDHNTGGMKLGNYRPQYTNMRVEQLTEPLKKMKLTGEGMLRTIGKPFAEITASELQGATSEYWGVDLTDEEADEIINYAENYDEVYRSSPVFPIPLTYGLGRVVSEKYTVVGWTSFGHNGDNVPMWVYGFEPPRHLIDNAEFGKLTFELIDAPDMSDLFVDLDTTELEYKVDTEVSYDWHAMIEGFKFPLNTDYFITGNGEVSKRGVTVYAPMIEKLYISQSAIDTVMELMGDGTPKYGAAPFGFSDVVEYPEIEVEYPILYFSDAASGEIIND